MGSDGGWPREYEVSYAKGYKIFGTAAFGCFVVGVAFMLYISSYPNTLSFVMGMLFLAYCCLMYFFLLRSLWHARVTVKWPAFTVVPALRRSKSYEVTEVTLVKCRSGSRSGRTVVYKTYSGRRKLVSVDSSMVNCRVLISMLKDRGVPFD